MEASGVDLELFEHTKNIDLDTGKAIALKWAAACVDDRIRTQRFVRGVHAAIKDLLKKKGGKPVTILYCGSGPFATLVMPLITVFSSLQLQFIFLEVNPISVEYLKKTLTSFNAQAYLKFIFVGDATTFQLPEGTEADILLVECLQRALESEPQVAINYNLLPQLNEDVVLIPKKISLYIGNLVKTKHSASSNNSFPFNDVVVKNSEVVFELSKDSVLKNSTFDETGIPVFSEERVVLDHSSEPSDELLAILTELAIYGNEKLQYQESGLTAPLIISDLTQDTSLKGVSAQYKLGVNPCLQIRII